MSIIAASGISKSFVTQLIFSDATFRIEEKDRIGIVGTNGAGKTTLFKILTGAEDVDEGTIYYDKRISVSYMEQLSALSGLPIFATTAESSVAAGLTGKLPNVLPLQLQEKYFDLPSQKPGNRPLWG